MGKITAYKQSRVEQRSFILAEFQKGCKTGKDLHKKLAKKFKNDPELVSLKSLYMWLARFKMGDFECEDKPRSGRPPTSEDKRIDEVLARDPYVSITDLYCELDLARHSTKAAMMRCGLMNVNLMWVPKVIVEEHRNIRIEHASSMVRRQEEDPFLDRVVFEGEKYITYNKYKRHFKTKDAKKVLRPNEALIAKSGMKPHRIVLHLWWTQRGLIMYKLLGEDVRTKEFYIQELDELRQALEDRTQFLVEDKPWILYHNRNTFLSDESTEKIDSFGWEQMLHPSNCPDMSPTDYQVFQKFQFAFNTTLFTQLEEVEEFVFRYFDTRRSRFYQEAVSILPEKWHRIIETEGEYIGTNEKV